MDTFTYKSGRHTDRVITIGQLEDLSFTIVGATFLTPDENRFQSVADIEEYLEDDLTMVIPTDDIETSNS